MLITYRQFPNEIWIKIKYTSHWEASVEIMNSMWLALHLFLKDKSPKIQRSTNLQVPRKEKSTIHTFTQNTNTQTACEESCPFHSVWGRGGFGVDFVVVVVDLESYFIRFLSTNKISLSGYKEVQIYTYNLTNTIAELLTLIHV